MIEQLLLTYLKDTEDAGANFSLGVEYERQGQTGSAFSFYLRTAERAAEDLLQYEALLRAALCIGRQGLRDNAEKTLLQRAVVLLPSRPEAYFLLARLFERKKDWQDCYTYACLGLTNSNTELAPLITNPEYPGEYALLFEKGVAGWWVGRQEEARAIMVYLNNDVPDIWGNFKSAVESNLANIGYDPQDSIGNINIFGRTKFDQPATAPAKISELYNDNPRPGIWVVDNFYKDADAIRKFALDQEYIKGGFGRGFIGSRTKNQFLFPGLKEEFERIMGREITKWQEHGMNGRFQYGLEGDPPVYHCDEQQWAGMLYLTPDAPYQTGTGTFSGRGTDVRHSSHPDIMQYFRPGSQNLDGTIFEPVDVIGNVYNRLVIFNARYLHSALGYFGYNKENCRLWQMFFFD